MWYFTNGGSCNVIWYIDGEWFTVKYYKTCHHIVYDLLKYQSPFCRWHPQETKLQLTDWWEADASMFHVKHYILITFTKKQASISRMGFTSLYYLIKCVCHIIHFQYRIYWWHLSSITDIGRYSCLRIALTTITSWWLFVMANNIFFSPSRCRWSLRRRWCSGCKTSLHWPLNL